MNTQQFLVLLLFLTACSKEKTTPSSTNTTQNYGTISTLIGPGSSLSNGDGGPESAATTVWPTAITTDATGNIYFTDGAFNTVRKITAADMTINTIAGTSYPSTDQVWYSGDNGPATQAHLNIPLSITIDGAGAIYIADAGNNAVREVSNSIMTSLVGSPTKLSGGYSGDGGPSTAATVFNPYAVAAAKNGDVFVADGENNAIRKIDHATGIITTIAGQGPTNAGYSGDGGDATKAKLNFPQGIVVDGGGNVFFSDQQMVIRMISTSGTISTFVGNGIAGSSGDGGSATHANLNGPVGLAIDSAGNLFIADAGNNAIRKVNASTKIITTVAGALGKGGFSGDGGPATSAKLNTPLGVTVDKSGNMYIVDSQNSRIPMVKPN